MPVAETSHHLRPVLVSNAEAQRISGYSRSEVYRQLAAGRILAVKAGSRTLIVLESLIEHLNSLPPATYRAPRRPGNERGDIRWRLNQCLAPWTNPRWSLKTLCQHA